MSSFHTLALRIYANESIGDTWENFLIQNHFKEGNQEQPNNRKEKRGRKRKFEDPVENEQQPSQEQSEDEVPISELLGNLKKQSDKKKEENTK